MPLSKQRISSPLEAGESILEAHNIPPLLNGALDYVSKRLARKALHITLVVVRKGYQLPSSVPPTPTSPPATPELGSPGLSSPARFASLSPVVSLRQLVRRGTNTSTTSISTSSSSSSDGLRSAATSPAFSPPPTEALTSPRRWPATPLSPPPRTPMTPHTPCSTTTTSSMASGRRGPQSPYAFGIRLIYATPLSPKEERTLRTTICKAERKFQIATGWLPPATTASACGLNEDLVRRSILQNEVLFSSEGLTLLGLDRLYTFKSALGAYSRASAGSSSAALMSPRSPTTDNAPLTRIEDAVDELRRLVLANGGRQVSRADLHRSYDWIGVNASALADVERMYRRAYGGRERTGAFEVAPDELEREARTAKVARAAQAAVVKIGTPPSSKDPTPVLKIITSIAAGDPKFIRPKPHSLSHPVAAERKDLVIEEDREIKVDVIRPGEGDEEDGDRTALPIQGMSFWDGLGASIGEMLQEEQRDNEDRQSRRVGPITPNGYDDISPVTRGEWGFLFAGDGWKQGKTAVVETC
ncbi:hypothetical protein DL766_004244 [Monosporascus sp. MC13-8B]|uniref:DUF7582 domain-containing protein n=1 Tax=Monosporascus cannonballus TaxID=155416 RepID=A0ABY0GS03_9PEZI|nr:hypothetical protein DL762_009930 [Monosporascus cannonballus]RYO81873.1 hypothetical protein DL763_008428 [Monosporascus cannonballus]RYP31795.1 hypothetical protein DL766_004244 [Monosporascus sp. MC13-8B]